MEQYAFTVKVTQQHTPADVNEKSYTAFFDLLRARGIRVILKQSEYDSKGFLHFHGIIEMKNNFYRKKIRSKGFHLYLKEIYDLEGWVRYVLKDTKQKFFKPLYPYSEIDNGALTKIIDLEDMAKDLHRKAKKQMKIIANNQKVIYRVSKFFKDKEDHKHTHDDDNSDHDIQKMLYAQYGPK